MKNPEIIILPILMFLDYFLTVYGAIQKESKYDEHFKIQHYELNPVWQNQIAEKRWFNPRHIFLVLAITVAIAGLTEFGGLPDSFIQGILGCIFVSLGMVIGRHLSNIMIFRYIADNSNGISGQITMAHSMSLSISMYQYIVAVIPMIFVALFAPAPFVLGGLVGAVFIFVVHTKWIFQHKRQSQSSSRAEVGGDK